MRSTPAPGSGSAERPVIAFIIRRMVATLFVMFALSVLVFPIFFAIPASTRRRASRAATPTR